MQHTRGHSGVRLVLVGTLCTLVLTGCLPVGPGITALLVANFGMAMSVLRYDASTGAFLNTFVAPGSGGLDDPEGLAFGPDGHLYVGSFNTGEVLRYSGTTGAFLDAFVPAGSGGLDIPVELAFGPDGNLYVSSCDTSEVLRYNGATGAFLDAFVPTGSGGLVCPTSLLFR